MLVVTGEVSSIYVHLLSSTVSKYTSPQSTAHREAFVKFRNRWCRVDYTNLVNSLKYNSRDKIHVLLGNLNETNTLKQGMASPQARCCESCLLFCDNWRNIWSSILCFVVFPINWIMIDIMFSMATSRFKSSCKFLNILIAFKWSFGIPAYAYKCSLHYSFIIRRGEFDVSMCKFIPSL